MKILTVTGTRPELIRLSIILRKLDQVCDHIHVYTNQNYDPNLSTIFLRDLRIRPPDYYFKKTEGLAQFLSNAIMEFDSILTSEKPDKVLFLGDTNSCLLSLIASKRGIPVYHMEAGNRCYDGQVPEETNRKVVDVCAFINLPYTENSKQNLINERFHKNFVFKVGNPIKEVLTYYSDDISKSDILTKLNLRAGEYALLTFHRTENVDNSERSRNVVDAVNEIAKDMPVVYSFHSRAKDQFGKHGIKFTDNVILTEPMGFFDFVRLEKDAKVVLTDSGTVPEETSIFGIPTIVLRNTTERQELNENGSCILAGLKKDDILRAYHSVTTLPQIWPELPDYHKMNVSDTVIRLLLGQAHSLVRKGHDDY
jgi:UDP-N-acetylglucosamine 2-epimerase (non-hydrolysing)